MKTYLPVKEGNRVNFLETKTISKSFGGLCVIADISFTLQEGETLGIIGPSGSGKTTLFNLISGFLKPDRGTLSFLGKDITGKNSSSVCTEGRTEKSWIVSRLYLDVFQRKKMHQKSFPWP